ncbi:unnamed protein product, partial [Musa textilis]
SGWLLSLSSTDGVADHDCWAVLQNKRKINVVVMVRGTRREKFY